MTPPAPAAPWPPQALANALRYFPSECHAELAPEFARELLTHGHIYMHRFRPTE